uniref:Secreted protein n=1 Tax=Lepeophtheirus salmonis TaxID=72036 RepID=A0A0K2TT37_LEPSM
MMIMMIMMIMMMMMVVMVPGPRRGGVAFTPTGIGRAASPRFPPVLELGRSPSFVVIVFIEGGLTDPGQLACVHLLPALGATKDT